MFHGVVRVFHAHAGPATSPALSSCSPRWRTTAIPSPVRLAGTREDGRSGPASLTALQDPSARLWQARGGRGRETDPRVEPSGRPSARVCFRLAIRGAGAQRLFGHLRGSAVAVSDVVGKEPVPSRSPARPTRRQRRLRPSLVAAACASEMTKTSARVQKIRFRHAQYELVKQQLAARFLRRC